MEALTLHLTVYFQKLDFPRLANFSSMVDRGKKNHERTGRQQKTGVIRFACPPPPPTRYADHADVLLASHTIWPVTQYYYLSFVTSFPTLARKDCETRQKKVCVELRATLLAVSFKNLHWEIEKLSRVHFHYHVPRLHWAWNRLTMPRRVQLQMQRDVNHVSLFCLR